MSQISLEYCSWNSHFRNWRTMRLGSSPSCAGTFPTASFSDIYDQVWKLFWPLYQAWSSLVVVILPMLFFSSPKWKAYCDIWSGSDFMLQNHKIVIAVKTVTVPMTARINFCSSFVSLQLRKERSYGTRVRSGHLWNQRIWLLHVVSYWKIRAT